MTLWCMETFGIPKALGCVASMPTQKSAHRQDTVAVMKWIFDGLQLKVYSRWDMLVPWRVIKIIWVVNGKDCGCSRTKSIRRRFCMGNWNQLVWWWILPQNCSFCWNTSGIFPSLPQRLGRVEAHHLWFRWKFMSCWAKEEVWRMPGLFGVRKAVWESMNLNPFLYFWYFIEISKCHFLYVQLPRNLLTCKILNLEAGETHRFITDDTWCGFLAVRLSGRCARGRIYQAWRTAAMDHAQLQYLYARCKCLNELLMNVGWLGVFRVFSMSNVTYVQRMICFEFKRI